MKYYYYIYYYTTVYGRTRDSIWTDTAEGVEVVQAGCSIFTGLTKTLVYFNFTVIPYGGKKKKWFILLNKRY